MNILFLTSSLNGGGAERVAVLLSNEWAKRGDHVTIMPTFSGRSGCSYQLHPNVVLDFLADKVDGSKNRFRRIKALRDYINHHAPDVVISFLPNVNTAALVAALWTKTPIVISERNNPELSTKVNLATAILRRTLYRFANSVVVQNSYIEEWIKKHCKARNTCIIPNPVVYPIEVSSPVLLPKDVIPTDRNYILAVGRMAPAKRQDIILKAFIKIANDHPNWNLVIVGEGPLQRKFERIVSSAGVEDRVFFPGFVGNIGDWYKTSDIYVLSSAFEGFPNSLVEAMSYNLPCLTFDIKTGPKEISENGNLAQLLPDDDHVARLSEGMSMFMSDSNLRKELGEKAGQVRKKFALNAVISQWDEVLAQAIKRRSRKDG